MSHVFISYSTQDIEYAKKLVAKLRSEGFDVWIDNEALRKGSNWWESIVHGIDTADAFIVIMSPASRASRWVQREVTLADEWRKPAFPLLLDGEKFEIYVLTQFEVVNGGILPSSSYYLDLAQHVTRQTKRGGIVTEQIKPQKDNSDIREAIKNPPDKDIASNKKQDEKQIPWLFVFIFALLIASLILSYFFFWPILQPQIANQATPSITNTITDFPTIVVPTITSSPSYTPTSPVASETYQASETSTSTETPSETAAPPTDTLEPSLTPTIVYTNGNILFVARDTYIHNGAGYFDGTTDMAVPAGISVIVRASRVIRGEIWYQISYFWGGASGWMESKDLRTPDGAIEILVNNDTRLTLANARCIPETFGCNARPIFDTFQVPAGTSLSIDCFAYRSSLAYYRATLPDNSAESAYLHPQSALQDLNGREFNLSENALRYTDGAIHILPNCE